ncbi:MAG: hypothetical protein QM751_05770 [Paludibacteraceae bacterium]
MKEMHFENSEKKFYYEHKTYSETWLKVFAILLIIASVIVFIAGISGEGTYLIGLSVGGLVLSLFFFVILRISISLRHIVEHLEDMERRRIEKEEGK